MDALKVAVVGGGVVGLLAALAAALGGHRVLLVEPRPRDPGSASYSNAGVLHVLQPPPGRRRVTMAPRAAPVTREIAEALGAPLLDTRLVLLGDGPKARVLLHAAAIAVRLLAPYARARVMDAAGLRGVEPLLARRWGRGLLVEPYTVVDPRGFMEALWREAEAAGVDLVEARAESITCRRGVEVRLDSGDALEAEAVVNAAGPGAEELARPHGVRVRTRRILGVMELYRRPRPEAIVARLPSRVRTESKGGAIIPWPGGLTLYGPSFHPDNRPPEPGSVAAAYRGLLEEDPEGPPDSVIMGYRTVADPRDFHVARPRACPRAVHLLGVESPGFTAAPLLAEKALRLAGVSVVEAWWRRLARA